MGARASDEWIILERTLRCGLLVWLSALHMSISDEIASIELIISPHIRCAHAWSFSNLAARSIGPKVARCEKRK